MSWRRCWSGVGVDGGGCVMNEVVDMPDDECRVIADVGVGRLIAGCIMVADDECCWAGGGGMGGGWCTPIVEIM